MLPVLTTRVCLFKRASGWSLVGGIWLLWPPGRQALHSCKKTLLRMFVDESHKHQHTLYARSFYALFLCVHCVNSSLSFKLLTGRNYKYIFDLSGLRFFTSNHTGAKRLALPAVFAVCTDYCPIHAGSATQAQHRSEFRWP